MSELSEGAMVILSGVKNAMQGAEEIGGVAGAADYILLMQSIEKAAHERRMNCAAVNHRCVACGSESIVIVGDRDDDSQQGGSCSDCGECWNVEA